MEFGNNLPLVSVIITSYNRAGMISKAIESALMQDYTNLEIIVSDNCSDDDTEKVIVKYLSDPRFRFSRNSENIGMIPNFRKATYEISKGEMCIRDRPIEIIEPEKTFIEGAPHGFNMMAVKDLSLIKNDLFSICENVSPKYIPHKDPSLHHHKQGF